MAFWRMGKMVGVERCYLGKGGKMAAGKGEGGGLYPLTHQGNSYNQQLWIRMLGYWMQVVKMNMLWNSSGCSVYVKDGIRNDTSGHLGAVDNRWQLKNGTDFKYLLFINCLIESNENLHVHNTFEQVYKQILLACHFVSVQFLGNHLHHLLYYSYIHFFSNSPIRFFNWSSDFAAHPLAYTSFQY